MAIYERTTGGHVAERVQPAPGSADAARYAVLAADPASGWRCVQPDKAPAKAPSRRGKGES